MSARKSPETPSDWQRESALLAPFALHSSQSKGREHAEPAHPYRGPFQRDRDRILHSAAFRRLSGKTQVFTGNLGDYCRTRLTHTMEVASIARTIGRALRLNEDLIEALALLHDIGHPPFGHAGEDALQECLAEDGGFSHNQFALTLVRELEHPYPEFPGLNLSHEILESQQGRSQKQNSSGAWLEAQVVDVADSITYDAHDVDDAVKLGLLPLDQLQSQPIIRQCHQQVIDRYGPLAGRKLRRALVHQLIDTQVGDVVQTSCAILQQRNFANAEEARLDETAIVASPNCQQEKEQLEAFLYRRVYRHPKLIVERRRAQQQLRALFQYLVEKPASCLPARFRARAELRGIRQAAADYLAGMTDRYCRQQYRRCVRQQEAP